MYPKIGTFELLFQKAGKRTLTYSGNNIFVNMPNIIYCYSSCNLQSMILKDMLFVVGTDEHINSIDDILNNEDEKIYGFNLPNVVYNVIGGFVSIGCCIHNAGYLQNVDNAAKYFLNSEFEFMPYFDFESFKIYDTAGSDEIKLSTFKDFFKFLKG